MSDQRPSEQYFVVRVDAPSGAEVPSMHLGGCFVTIESGPHHGLAQAMHVLQHPKPRAHTLPDIVFLPLTATSWTMDQPVTAKPRIVVSAESIARARGGGKAAAAAAAARVAEPEPAAARSAERQLRARLPGGRGAQAPGGRDGGERDTDGSAAEDEAPGSPRAGAQGGPAQRQQQPAPLLEHPKQQQQQQQQQPQPQPVQQLQWWQMTPEHRCPPGVPALAAAAAHPSTRKRDAARAFAWPQAWPQFFPGLMFPMMMPGMLPGVGPPPDGAGLQSLLSPAAGAALPPPPDGVTPDQPPEVAARQHAEAVAGEEQQ